MPLASLLVEGDLDVAVLNAVKPAGGPLIERGGPKDSLRHRAGWVREWKRVDARYLRDRDFDTEPPADTSRPMVDRTDKSGTILGWRWCRHEIENYLLEPGLVEAATGWSVNDYSAALVDAGRRLAAYSAARWVLGQLRERVMGAGLVSTRGAFNNEIAVPPDLSLEACEAWMLVTVDEWRDRAERPSAAEASSELRRRTAALAALSSTVEVLLWHGGKDLFAALAEPLRTRKPSNSTDLRRHLRDWVRDHPEVALEHLTEWRGLFDAIAALP